VRPAVLACAALLVGGCGGGGGGGQEAAVQREHQVCRPTRASAYTVCGYPLQQRTTSSIWASFGRSAVRLTGPAEIVKQDPHPAGFWVPGRLFPSPDGNLLLAQWSGQCEVQSTYLVSVQTGERRSILRRTDESSALGWTKEGSAKIMVPRPTCGSSRLAVGIYAIDPSSLRPTLVRRIKPRPGGP
jgi:hypothetical protein